MSKKIILHPRTEEGIIQDTEEVYPKTTIDQVYTEDGTTPFGNNSFQKKLTAGDGISLDSLGNISVNFNSTVLKTLLLNLLYPIGSLFISTNVSEQNECPIKYTLGGTWERVKDRFLLASGDTYAIGSTGGFATITPSGTITGGAVQGHTLTINEMPAHNHPTNWTNNARRYLKHIGSGGGGLEWVFAKDDLSDYQSSWDITVNPSGGGQSHTHGFTQPTFTGTEHSNLPPYLTVCVWKRIA